MSAGFEDPQAPEISVVCAVGPASRELAAVHAGFRDALAATGRSYEFLYVIDGQARDIAGSLEDVTLPAGSIRVWCMARGFGEASALAFGFDRARGRFVLTIPDRPQVEPRAVIDLLARLDAGHDVVVTCREPRADPWVNRLQNRLFHRLVRRLTGIDFRDLTCGLRGMKREAARRLDLYGDQHRFVPVVATQAGLEVIEIPVPQHAGDRGLRLRAPGVYGRRLLDLLRLYFIVRFTRKPLRFFGSIGGLLLLAGAGITAWLGVERLLGRSALAGRPMLLLGVLLFVVGVQLVSIGLLGEIVIFLSSRRATPEVRELEPRSPDGSEQWTRGNGGR